MALLDPPGCVRCGRPLEVAVERCVDCPPVAVTWARSPFLYEGPVRRALMRMKFAGLRSTADAFAPWCVWALARSPPDRPPPAVTGTPVVLTWVPLARGRRRTRGYDQAEALARAIGRITRWPVRRLLERTVETAAQARRPGRERRRALRGAFGIVATPPELVVLVDDVLTSGATAASCAEALRAGGARRVGLVCAARALGGPVPARCYNPRGFQPGSVVARGTFSR